MPPKLTLQVDTASIQQGFSYNDRGKQLLGDNKVRVSAGVSVLMHY